jgi:hypothetical protein
MQVHPPITLGSYLEATWISRVGLRYKAMKARWDDIDSMEVQSGLAGRRLVVWVSGGWFAWCWADLTRIPNNDVVYHVLCRTAPPRLLKTV